MLPARVELRDAGERERSTWGEVETDAAGGFELEVIEYPLTVLQLMAFEFIFYSNSMAPQEPRTEQEYAESVKDKAREHENEHVPSHSEIFAGFERDKQTYQSRLNLCTGFLIIAVISLLVIRGMPLVRSYMGEGEN